MRPRTITHYCRHTGKTGRRGTKLVILSSAFSVATTAFPQTNSVPYGQAGGWVVLKMPQGRCWTASGHDTSLYGISLDKAGNRALLFSAQNGRQLKSFPGQVAFKDTFVDGRW